jgi:replicative DNA helicase
MNEEEEQEELKRQRQASLLQDMKELEEEAKEAEEKAWQEEDKRCCTYEKFEDAIRSYNPEKDFKPSLLCGCACPEGSISIIAARPAGGKTSSMINIVRETLMSNTNTETAERRKILYVNLEMNFRQILTNLHLSCIYGFATEEEREMLAKLKRAKAAFYRTVKGREWKDECWVIDEDEFLQPVNEDLKQLFETNYRKARKLIREAMESINLKIYDGIGLKLEDVIKKIEKSPKGTLVLLDYMQRLPAPEGVHNTQRYLQIQKSSAELLKAAIKKQLIVIAGAQLRREGGEKGKETTPSMESIRESGDIEQDAHNVVILNKDYAEVVKAREGCESSHKKSINTVKQFVFWETCGEHKPTSEDDHKTNGKKEKTVEKKKLKALWD